MCLQIGRQLGQVQMACSIGRRRQPPTSVFSRDPRWTWTPYPCRPHTTEAREPPYRASSTTRPATA